MSDSCRDSQYSGFTQESVQRCAPPDSPETAAATSFREESGVGSSLGMVPGTKTPPSSSELVRDEDIPPNLDVLNSFSNTMSEEPPPQPEDEPDHWSDCVNVTFPGPLMSAKLQKDKLISFIKGRLQECLLDDKEPVQSYFFWLIMERFCNQSGRVTMAEISMLLFTGYGFVRRNSGCVMMEDWCLPLARSLCSLAPADEQREALIEMGDEFVSKGWTYAAQICFTAAQMELGSRQQFRLIGSVCWSGDCSAMRKVMEKTEVYEYVLSLSSGVGQLDFQVFKYYYTCDLAMSKSFAQAHDYCECIAVMCLRFPHCLNSSFISALVVLCEAVLAEGFDEVPEWLLKLFALQNEARGENMSVEEQFQSRYCTGKLLGNGAFGCVYFGFRKADGTPVAIKYVSKGSDAEYISLPEDTRHLPLEVALMELTSSAPRCENVVELLEWFEVPDQFILVLERPKPCMDLQSFYHHNRNNLPEPLSRTIMRQVIRATVHCFDRGVFHRDLKPENLLINPDTQEVKLIDFGCGHLMKDGFYTVYSGTPAFTPPEWIVEQKYLAVPATVWSLGIFLFEMVCGDLPFNNNKEISAACLPQVSGLSKECYSLISWCLAKDPNQRPSLEEIRSHRWLKEEIPDPVQTPSGSQDPRTPSSH